MQKSKFPKIQIRLLLSLAILVIVIGINSIIYILDVKNMNNLTQDIINHPFIVSNGVRDIEINYTSQTMSIGTHGRGIWQAPLHEPLVCKKCLA